MSKQEEALNNLPPPPNDDSEAPPAPHAGESLTERVSELPVIQSAMTSAKDGYEHLKQSNEYVASGLGYVESGVGAASSKAGPYVEAAKQKLEQYDVSGKGHGLLDKLEEKYPIVKEPTAEIVNQSKEALNTRVAMTKEGAGNVYTSIIEAVKKYVPAKHGTHSDGEVKDAVDKGYMGQIYDVSNSLQEYLYTCAQSSREYAAVKREAIVKEVDVAKYSAMLSEQSSRLQASVASTQAYVLSNIPAGIPEKATETAAALKQKANASLDSLKFETLTQSAKEMQNSLTSTVSTLVNKSSFKLPPAVQEPVDILSTRLTKFISTLKEDGDTMTAASTFSAIGKEAQSVWDLLKDSFTHHLQGQAQGQVNNDAPPADTEPTKQ